MAEEEHNSRSSNSSSGGGGGDAGRERGGDGSSHRSSKKLKTKKVPQRGMGVAQLEKIISEQRQKKDAAVFTNCSSNVRPPPPPPTLPPNHFPWMSKADGINPMLASKSTNFGGGGGSWSRLLNDGAYNFQGERQTQTQNQNLNLGGLRYESNPPFWPPSPNLMMQRPQHMQPPCSSSMLNVSAGTSLSSSSSLLNLKMEPPSNQSYYGNNYHHLQAHEEKMIGTKRPYPFLLESGPMPSVNGKLPSAYASPIYGTNGSASGSNGGTTSIEPSHPSFRENQLQTRDFLKLSPPQASQTDFFSSSNEKLHLSSYIGDQSQFETPPPQKDQSEDPSHFSGRGGPNQRPFFGFFPEARAPIGQQEDSDCEAGENVDLNLKL